MKFVYINRVSNHFNNPPLDTTCFAVKVDSIDDACVTVKHLNSKAELLSL